MNILERMRAGELIFDTDPEYPSLYAEFEKTMKLVAQLNSGYHTPEEIRDLLGRIWGQPLDESVRMFPPFYTNFGKFTRVGRGVFINFGCTFLDRGGITLEDGVFIGPGVLLVTENHPEQPAVRRNVYAKPIVVGHGVWIGAGAVILPGVTIGEHAVVGAGAIVTKDVPAGVIVAGNPARIVRSIKTGIKLSFMKIGIIAAALAFVGLSAVAQTNQKTNMDMKKLELVQEWDKTFPKSDKVEHSKVVFRKSLRCNARRRYVCPKKGCRQVVGRRRKWTVRSREGTIVGALCTGACRTRFPYHRFRSVVHGGERRCAPQRGFARHQYGRFQRSGRFSRQRRPCGSGTYRDPRYMRLGWFCHQRCR